MLFFLLCFLYFVVFLLFVHLFSLVGEDTLEIFLLQDQVVETILRSHEFLSFSEKHILWMLYEEIRL